MSRIGACGAVAFLAAAMALATAAPATAQGQRPRQRTPDTRRGRAVLTAGVDAPDFELPVLRQEKDAKGKTVNRITKERVKLSSFEGRKIVCVFFSSYT